MRTNYSIKNTITSFISNIVSFIFLFISQTIFIKILGIEYTGLNGLFGNVLTLLNLFELGIGNAIIFNLYKYIANNNKEKIKSLIEYYKKSYNIIALIILLVGLCITPFIKLIVKEQSIDINIYIVYILFLLSTVSTYILAYKRNLIYAYQRNYVLNIIHVGYIVILNTLQLLIIFITKNYYLYLIVKIICILLENIIISIKANKDYIYLLDKNIKPIDNKTKNNITNRVKALFIHKTSSVITYGTDNILISLFFGLKEVGLYTNYHYIIQTIDTIFRNIISSTNASVGNLLVEDKYEKRYEVFKNIKFLNYWIAVHTTICLLILIEPFIKIWLGSNYLLNKLVLVVLIINYYQSMMRTTYNVFKDSAGIWIEDKYIPIIQAILNLITSIIFVKLLGLAGVFIGTILSSLVLWFYSYPKYVYKKILNRNYKEYYKQLIIDIFIFVIIMLITYYVSNLILIKHLLLDLLIKIIICILLPNILMYLIFRKSNQLNYYIKLIKTKIPTK